MIPSSLPPPLAQPPLPSARFTGTSRGRRSPPWSPPTPTSTGGHDFSSPRSELPCRVCHRFFGDGGGFGAGLSPAPACSLPLSPGLCRPVGWPAGREVAAVPAPGRDTAARHGIQPRRGNTLFLGGIGTPLPALKGTVQAELPAAAHPRRPAALLLFGKHPSAASRAPQAWGEKAPPHHPAPPRLASPSPIGRRGSPRRPSSPRLWPPRPAVKYRTLSHSPAAANKRRQPPCCGRPGAKTPILWGGGGVGVPGRSPSAQKLSPSPREASLS